MQKPIIRMPFFPWCSAQECKGMTGELRQEPVSFPSSWFNRGATPSVSLMPIGSSTYGSFMSDPITFDRDLDYRSDAVYVGRSIDPNAGAPSNVGYWWGKF